MNPSDPQHSSQPPHGPPMPYTSQGREPMRGGAVTGGILALSSAGVVFLVTFADWAYEPPELFGNPLKQNLWELGGSLGFFPFGFFGVVAFANVVLSVIFMAMNSTRQRQGTATSLTMAAFLQLIAFFTVGVAAEENQLSGSDGTPWILSLLGCVILIAGSITALVGSRSPAVEAVGPPPAPAPPHPSQTDTMPNPGPPPSRPERSLTSSIEELAALRDKGFLSEEEFEQKRREILGLD